MATTSDIENVARVLRGGGLVALPTETVYGLGANAEDPAASPASSRSRDVRPPTL